MKTETITYKDGSTHNKIVVDPKADSCPICDTPLSTVSFSWNIFHGEASASCCGAPYQLKSYYVDEQERGKEAADFAESLDAPDRIQCKIDGKYLNAYRQALKELGENNINSDAVYKRTAEILGE